MQIKKSNKRVERYIPLDEIKKIDNAFLTEMESVKTRLNVLKDPEIIKAFHEVLLDAYKAAIEIKTLECEVDYDIKLAEIRARRNALKPWRGGRWRRLFFLPTINRAQDIIDSRADLEADKIHTTAENAIDDEYKRLGIEEAERKAKQKKLSKRALKRLMREKLKEAIKNADNADLNEALTEPPALPSVVPQPQENATTAPMSERENVQQQRSSGQLPGQIRLDEVQTVTSAPHRPRPPRSCRKPS